MLEQGSFEILPPVAGASPQARLFPVFLFLISLEMSGLDAKTAVWTRLINLSKGCAIQGLNLPVPLCNSNHLRVKAHKAFLILIWKKLSQRGPTCHQL